MRQGPLTLFQSTLPARGATAQRVTARCGTPYFNPRSPHGERPRHGDGARVPRHISIHAPRTGSDRRSGFHAWWRIRAFQSTLPARGATKGPTASDSSSADFNPRSPHGERPRDAGKSILSLAISIHAPRTGSDAAFLSLFSNQEISIHAPRTGSDDAKRVLDVLVGISIHAPRTGSDPLPAVQAVRHGYFNPRSPHGERHPSLCPKAARRSGHFNPRSPHGERHFSGVHRAVKGAFQSTLPARGATLRSAGAHPALDLFQSTLPARGATRSPSGQLTAQLFQSTLPARGATTGRAASRSPRSQFQSTLPARGATHPEGQSILHRQFQSTLPARGATDCEVDVADVYVISIHAPRTGSDCKPVEQEFLNLLFQSTLPARGATRCYTIRINGASGISIHAPRTGSDFAQSRANPQRC